MFATCVYCVHTTVEALLLPGCSDAEHYDSEQLIIDQHRISEAPFLFPPRHLHYHPQKKLHRRSVPRPPPRLRLASASSPDEYRSLLSQALRSAVYHGSASMVEYLLSQEKAPGLDTLTPLTVAVSPSIELLSVLVSHGWDLNRRQPDHGGPGQRLLDFICGDEALVRWCLEHGASAVEDLEPDPFKRPPLLESAAAFGTVSTFQLLHERGARLGRRTLHRAVRNAAHCSKNDLKERMEMVRYLVDGLGLDVNQMDTEEGVKLPDCWGPPICYAAMWEEGKGGAEVVRFLLERGADPTIRDCWGINDAFRLAEFNKNQGMLEVLREWREQKQKQKQNQGG